MAEKLNCYSLFRDMPRDPRSVREQFNKLEEIAEAMESTPLRVENANSKKDDKKRKEALACRDKAMTTWAKAGASGDISDSGHESDTEEDC